MRKVVESFIVRESVLCVSFALCDFGENSPTVSTQIEEKCARTLELPLLVRRYAYSFLFGSNLGLVCGVFPSLS